MAKGILGRKIGMTQIFGADGQAIPVTVVEAGPCVVVQKKSTTTDGYEAIQLGFGEKRERLFNKPLRGHFAKHGITPRRFLREIRLEEGDPSYEVGQEIKVDIFREGEYVDVTGRSKGKGFAGVIKRWNFNRAPMAHGSMYHRRVGSLCATDPARVFKNRKLPGRMGGERVTVQGLRVVKVDPERNLLLVKGAVPGPKGGLLIIKETVKRAKRAQA
ncbi:MAG: 50S ribosomal protein L3 [Firmicutes bacterium]|nr:50S ribosomal protein L3 [Bacillota bacterium]